MILSRYKESTQAMKSIGRISVFPKLPTTIARLQELAYNLWWSWEPDAQALFTTIDPQLWDATNHNPVKFLRNVPQQRLETVATDKDFLHAYATVMAAFDAYMAPTSPSWFGNTHSDKRDQVIAYFSAEFGLHEALPIYSGGLGVLSGDHCKEASDLNLPFIGVGFLYPQGYFTQRIDAEGRQQAEYEKIDFAEMPVSAARDPQGNEVLINVDLPGRTVYAKVWKIQVGRIPIYVMDTDVPRNAPQDRELSARLYGGDREMRISQEVVLGIGGVRAVRALGYQPATWHMNEGHSAFLGLERIRELIQEKGLSFDQAVEAVRANALFTTHTPVPAGNDSFAFELVEKFFWQYWGQLGIDRDRFINFAAQELPWGAQYSMTVLALRLSAFANGVSKLHGEVSRDMWNFLWPETPAAQVPIGHITNGVHTKTWLARELRALYSQYLGTDWLEEVDNSNTWTAVDQIPDAELWAVHEERKQLMVDHIRERVKRQYLRYGEGPRRIKEAEGLLDPHALTLGFARRFATYKRATLIFKDEARLLKLLNDPARPVQIVFSGKAHPADEPGKALIQHIYQLSQRPEFSGKIIFVENYDMNIARHLVAGVDVWLNTPRRPHEASGTSGEKAALCGSPNFSVLDGWWVEGFDGENGWSIGEERAYKDEATQDDADVQDLYTTLEEEIIPLFYQRDGAGVPNGWVAKMKNAIRSCAPRFSMRRMVKEYTETYYLPAAVHGQQFSAENYALARELADWKGSLGQRWQALQVQAAVEGQGQITVGEPLQVRAKLWLNGVEEAQVAVELIAERQSKQKSVSAPLVVPMQAVGHDNGAIVYEGTFTPRDSGVLTLAVRARPTHKGLINPHEIALSRWA